jgi:trimeric autotransporter adhesin
MVAGIDHNLAITTAGTVAAWGNNYDRQAAVPAGLTNVVPVAAGIFYSLAVTSDGAVVAWGNAPRSWRG